MDVAALDQAMMEEMVQAANEGDPGPFYGYDFAWSDAAAVAHGTMSATEAATHLVAQNTEVLTAALKHRPRSEIVLAFLQRMAIDVVAQVDWDDDVAYNRMRSKRNAFLDDERNRAVATALYFECCTAAAVTSPAIEVWRAVYGSDEAREWQETLRAYKPYDGNVNQNSRRARDGDRGHTGNPTWSYPAALRIAVRLLGDFQHREEISWRNDPSGRAAGARFDLVEACHNDIFLFAVCGLAAPLFPEHRGGTSGMAMQVVASGRQLLNGDIGRDGERLRPDPRDGAYRQSQVDGLFDVMEDGFLTDDDGPDFTGVKFDVHQEEGDTAVTVIGIIPDSDENDVPVPNLAAGLSRYLVPPWSVRAKRVKTA